MNASPQAEQTEIAIVGGGLAGGLIALALRQAQPDMAVRLFESGEALGGNHRWSWFDRDLDEDGKALLVPFPKASWDSYDVRFPAYHRTLDTGYNSLASADFNTCLERELHPDTIQLKSRVAALDCNGVTLNNGNHIAARTVIDCRNMAPDHHLEGGWQVFLGHHLRTTMPHAIERPVIMDARVRQHGAYRFVYVLPLGPHELFIEDTYYADSPVLDRDTLSDRIDHYCERHGLHGTILGSETGILPVITGGNFAAWQSTHKVAGVSRAGTRGGFVHPLTSYSLPFAVHIALEIARNANLPGDQMATMLDRLAKRHWKHTAFYRKLGRMLFGAGMPEQRHRIFEHFYRIDQARVERFYAARSTASDKLRILAGRPPVPLGGAITALASKGQPLERQMDSDQ